MTDIPAMLLWTDAYMADTSHLTTVEHGAYLLLLMEFHRKGSLSGDDAILARVCRMSGREWLSVKETVLSLFYNPAWWDGKTAAEHALGIGRRESRPSIPAATRALVAERDQYKCVYCGDENGPFDVDHVHPFSRGGAHSIENFAWACAPCNRSKGAKTLEEWRQ